ncbi:MAG: OprO/OprP family phosphate-selective porin [Bacteroidales bacterium]|nr:OprO/OprP family phosphate-selective porin [Bacteroidales bacterium]
MPRYNYTSDAYPSNTFNIRMARLSLSGRVMDEFAYNVLLQMEGTPARALEASVEWQRYSGFRIKIGQFKIPFTFESPDSAIDQGFYRRSMTSYKLGGYNDRRLSAGSHNYFMFDFQMGLRF